MAGMERFTQRARRVLSFAHQEAEKARNNPINTEHLLLGLMLEEGGVGGLVLRALGMTTDRVREVIGRITNVSTDFDPNRVELGSEIQSALEYAVDEARRLGHHYIGTEHILLGLVRVDSTGMEVLRRLGVTAEQIRRQTRRILNESATVGKSKPHESGSTKKVNQVLLIYGNDIDLWGLIAGYLRGLGLEVMPLGVQGTEFKTLATEVVFVVVLLTPANLIAVKSDSSGSKYVASPNVVYELGFFHGKLGPNRVCALFKNDPEMDLKLLSEASGVSYVPIEPDGNWKLHLAKQMQDAGIIINSRNIQ
jgi:hypothetical protein